MSAGVFLAQGGTIFYYGGCVAVDMRALVLVMDSVGVGNAPDAAMFGDAGAATVPHILGACPGLRLPTLFALGLGQILGMDEEAARTEAAGGGLASFGRGSEVSAGKDSTTGQWELGGSIRNAAFGHF